MSSVRDRHQDLVELRLHDVLQLQTTRSLLELDFFVVRKIDRDRFRARVRLTGVEDCVVRVEVRVSARLFLLVLLRNRNSLLQRRKHRGVASKDAGSMPCP